MVTPSTFTIEPPSQEGSVYITDFTFSFPFSSFFEKITWNLGDRNFVYNKNSVTHSYNFPGIYTVSLSAWNREGFLTTDFAEINLDYIYRDALIFSKVPSENGTAGIKSSEFFTLSLTSCKINEPISVVLQPFNTNSVPHYAVEDKWKYITPRWRFINAQTNETLGDQVSIKTDNLFVNSKVAGVSGQFSFYYVDDSATVRNKCPLLIAATLSTQNFIYPTESLIYPYFSYSNSDVVRASIEWQMNDSIPSQLKISENYINQVYPLKWSNIPIPFLVHCYFNSDDLESFSFLTSAQQGDALSYPLTNELGSLNPVKVILSADGGEVIPENLYTVEVNNVSYPPSAAPLYFQNTDVRGNLTSGYLFTTITPLTSFPQSVVIAVSTVATNQEPDVLEFGYPVGFPINTNVFISNPIASTINRLNLTLYTASECQSVDRYNSLKLLTKGGSLVQDVPIVENFDLATYTLSGNSAIYNLSYNPLKKFIYAADADLDSIYIFNTSLNLLSTVMLSSYTGNDYNVPSYISIDKDSNLWVSLFGNMKVLKFDSNFNLLLSAIPTITVDIATVVEGSLLLEPPIVETDFDANVWVCYAHPMSSMLVKFDGESGNEILQSTELPISATPVSLAIDLFNNVWVACYDSNQILSFDSLNGNLIFEVPEVYHPSYIAFDRSSSLWFTHGINRISVYNIFSGELKTWRFADNILTSINNQYTQQEIDLVLQSNEVWGGLTIDVLNRLWVIDSENNTVVSFSVEDPDGTYSTINALPKPIINRVVRGGETFITENTENNVRSAQAAGDWSGNRWYQKYANAYKTLPINGKSSPFKVYDINESFKIAKVNEDFDTAGYFKSLALPQILKTNDYLFDKFFTAVLGNGDLASESIGETVYEKIANFVQTHGDLETVDIKQLTSFAEAMDVNARNYGGGFPREINKFLNLFSINKHFLRGQIDYDADVDNNVGRILTDVDVVSAGQYIFARSKRYNEFQLVYVTPLDSGESQYTLNLLEVEGFKKPLLDNYYFFLYQPSPVGFKNNIIDWNSDFTTLNYALSTNEDWYGENGIVETMFNNLLTKRLFLD